MNCKKLLSLMIDLMLVALLLAACGGEGGEHPAISVVKQYIELGRKLDLKEDVSGNVNVAPFIREALDLWDGAFVLDEDEVLVPLLSQYYETIAYEVVEDKGNKVQVQVSFSDPNDAEMKPEVTLNYLVIRQKGEWLIKSRVQ